MKFYTNITRWGNQLLLREYVDGQRLNRRIKYSPTMYSIVTKPITLLEKMKIQFLKISV